jgi:hypothetical protein
MSEAATRLAPCLGAAAAAIAGLTAEVQRDRARLAVLFPGLPRKFGREPVGGGRQSIAGAVVDLDAFRACDIAATLLLLAVSSKPDELWELYAHGDIEERAMLLRALHFLPLSPATARLFGEVQRTNMVLHVEAAVCDGDLLARLVGTQGFALGDGNRMLLKLAFLDLPLARAFAAERHANAELSRMLQDLATEREAAGRAVWRDTWRLIGRAPCPGSVARLVGGLEHGDDGVRLAAAEGLLALGRKDLAPFARERLPREVRAEIAAVLQRLTA